MWLKDANCAKTIGYNPDSSPNGQMSWLNALDFVAGINDGTFPSCGAGYTDWRLPNVIELRSLINAGVPITADWLQSQGFINVQTNDAYWSSTKSSRFDIFGLDEAWLVIMWNGEMWASDAHRYVWTVRSTTTPPSQLWKTGQTTSYYPGDDGDIQAGVDWPVPRFTDNGDGTVTDNLTDLIWLKDADCFGAMTWQEALDTIADFNANPGNYSCQEYTSLYTNWRLPNIQEQLSLIDFSEYEPALPAGHPFGNGQFGGPDMYWSSTTSTSYNAASFGTYLQLGGLGVIPKSNNNYLWPVRENTPISGLVTGFVTDSAHIPIPRAKVMLRHKGSLINVTRTDVNGWYEFKGLEDGWYSIIARRWGYKKDKKTGIIKQSKPWGKNEYINLVLE
jgi:hypothetical protein